MWKLLLIGLAAFVVSCADDACDAVEGQDFASLTDQECGLAPNGVALCPWRISFSSGTFQWTHSDIQEGGTYSCDGDTLTGITDTISAGTYEGVYDHDREILTWDELEYARQ